MLGIAVGVWLGAALSVVAVPVLLCWTVGQGFAAWLDFGANEVVHCPQDCDNGFHTVEPYGLVPCADCNDGDDGPPKLRTIER